MDKAEDVVFIARFPSNSRFLNVSFCVVTLLARSSSNKQNNNSERAAHFLADFSPLSHINVVKRHRNQWQCDRRFNYVLLKIIV